MSSMWHIVGAAVVGAATHVPLLARSSEVTSMRRGTGRTRRVGRASGSRYAADLGRVEGKGLLN